MILIGCWQGFSVLVFRVLLFVLSLFEDYTDTAKRLEIYKIHASIYVFIYIL